MNSQQAGYQAGFTLIELMTVVAMVAIMAAMAMPSYSQYVRRSAAEEARTSMLALAEDLQRYQSKNFTFKGYAPEQGFNTGNKDIYLPKGSGASDYRYKLTLMDGGDWSSTLPGTATGQSWVMIAVPNPSNTIIKSAPKIVLGSLGQRCQTLGNVDTAAKTCGSSGENW